MRTIIILKLLFILLGSFTLKGQEVKQYEYLNLEQFLHSKTENDTSFMKAFFKYVEYPKIAKEQKIEGRVEVLVFNHPDKAYEVVIVGKPIFYNLKQVVENTIGGLEIDRTMPFMLRFNVYFMLDTKHLYSKKQYEQSYLGIIENTISIMDYSVPLISIDILHSGQ